MGILRHIVLVIAATLVASVAGAQDNPDAHVRIADRWYQQMAYAFAIDEYKAAADLGALNEHVTKRLADCYMRTGNSEEAERWYGQAVKFLNREPRDLYNYAEALKSNGKYDQAEEWMDRYLAMAQPEGQPHRSNIADYAKKFTYTTDRFSVRNMSAINTPYSDFGTAWMGQQGVVFASARHAPAGIKRMAAWNNEPFLDLFVADRANNGDLGNVRPLQGDVNSKLHEGPATCSVNNDVMWFTRNNRVKSQNGISRLSIWSAQRKGVDWSGVQPFLYNNSETSVGHPALSPDGKRLYFVSDMPGGFGGTDIYVCKDLGGQWGEPENLGATVNTAFNEGFPFIAADGTLYFASNGHPGLGGLDIFAAQMSNGAFNVAINVGAPVNGPRDDFAFIIDAAGKNGYFSSDRPGGKGDDDIYGFTMNAPLEQRYLCTGLVIDDENEQPLIEVEVQLLDKDGSVLESTVTDVKGSYSFAVQKDMEYRVVARMKGRYDGEQHLSTESIEQEQILARDIHLVPDAGIFLRGAVRQKDKLGFIDDMKVSVVNLASFDTQEQLTGEGGDFDFRLQPNEKFEVLLEKQGYFSMSVPVSTIGMKQGVIDLNEAVDLAFEPMVIGQPIRFKYIRWAVGSAQLDPVAKTELDALAERLQVNPTLTVEIAVHCDARGDAEANLKLTQKRADAIVEHLRSKGVPKDHMVAKGYGATKLLNHCGPGVDCTEAEHAENRRTEYTVTGNTQ